MIGDAVRTDAYKEAIFASVAGLVVIDVGAGTGILSMFAVEGGAKHVYAIEASDIVKVCRDQVRSKGLTSKIEVIHAKAEEVTWLQKTADVIVSEWIGYFLLFERMLPSVLAVRDTHLKKDGIMIPRRARMMIAGVSADRNSYGIDLSNAGLQEIEDICVMPVGQDRLITQPACLQDLNLKLIRQDFDSFLSTIDLVVTKEDILTGLVGWFEVEMTFENWLSTAPDKPLTHWQQVFFPLPGSKAVRINEKLHVRFDYSPAPEDHRGMLVELELTIEGSEGGIFQRYIMV
jgi:hypothetical protein